MGLRATERFIRALVATAEHEFALEASIESNLHVAESSRLEEFEALLESLALWLIGFEADTGESDAKGGIRSILRF